LISVCLSHGGGARSRTQWYASKMAWIRLRIAEEQPKSQSGLLTGMFSASRADPNLIAGRVEWQLKSEVVGRIWLLTGRVGHIWVGFEGEYESNLNLKCIELNSSWVANQLRIGSEDPHCGRSTYAGCCQRSHSQCRWYASPMKEEDMQMNGVGCTCGNEGRISLRLLGRWDEAMISTRLSVMLGLSFCHRRRCEVDLGYGSRHRFDLIEGL